MASRGAAPHRRRRGEPMHRSFVLFAAATSCVALYCIIIVSVNPLAIRPLLQPVRRALELAAAGLSEPANAGGGELGAGGAPWELDPADLPSVERLRAGLPVTEVSVVLPMREKDWPRFRLLHATLRAFLEPAGVSEILLVVPDESVPRLRALLRALDAPSPEANRTALPYELVPEGRLVPQLRRYRRLWGWYKQQVLKLAAGRAVRSDFYLVLDADCLLARPLALPRGLFDAGRRALTNFEARAEHGEWWRSAEAMLGWRGPPLDPVFGVTPAVLHRAGAGAAVRRLERRFAGDWRDVLLANAGLAGWTEYSLYYVAAMGAGIFDLAHARAQEGVYRLNASVWWAGALPAWDAAAAFDRAAPGYFLVVQSNTHFPPPEVARRIAPFVPGLQAEPAAEGGADDGAQQQ